MSSTRDIALVRTHSVDSRVIELASQMGDSIGFDNVYIVVDEMSKDVDDSPRRAGEIPFTVLPVTKGTLRRLGLDYEGPRTGWKCGDYVPYRALSEDWRNAWVIEPDVQLLNGAESIFVDTALKSDTDLACLNYREVETDWFWADSFRDWLPGRKVASMAFPVFRVSRALAEAALELRREVHTRDLDTPRERPNDESIVASAALNGGFGVTDLRKGRKSWFDCFSTVIKYHGPSLMAKRFDPLIVHSGVDVSEIVAFARREVKKVLNGDRTATSRLSMAASKLSPELLSLILKESLDEACDLSRDRRGLALDTDLPEGHLS